MVTKHSFRQKFFIVLAFVVLQTGISLSPARAALNPTNFTNDLNQLVVSGNTLLATMENVTIKSFTMASQLANLENSVQTYLDSVGTVYRTVSGSQDNTTMSLTDEMLVPLQTLAAISASLSQSSTALMTQIVVLAPFTSLSTLSASLDSILRLSSDIGVMADRILEMADMILIMADNIGIMADRILATQVIQGDNLNIVVAASLETQKNILMLFSMFAL
ncbi:MAG: hypothetical protein KKA54_14310 [Proteobacteria bacterium]|nr:hypothetical protein [Pseudomonadota bacterium]